MDNSPRNLIEINTRMRYNRFWSNPSLSGITDSTFIAVNLTTPELDDVIVLVCEFGYEKVESVLHSLEIEGAIDGVNAASARRMLDVIRDTSRERAHA